MNNIILGGGITGLILLELAKEQDFVLMTNNIGGQLTEPPFSLGPRILQYSPKVDMFLQRIGISENIKSYKIGYLVDGNPVNEVTKEQRQFYFTKTRGIESEMNATCLSEGKKEIHGWDMNKIRLVKKLTDRNKKRIKHLHASRISHCQHIIYDQFDNPIRYRNLISTIDFKILLHLLDMNEQFARVNKKKVYYTLVYTINPDVLYRLDLDYVYDITHPVINRITKVSEFFRVIESSEELSELPGYRIIDEVCYHTQIQHELKIEKYKGIKLIGRYAQYDHSIKANNIIDKYFNGVEL